ncbi:MAG TPA: enolase C-terminal domain-like protein [Solirubrobacteraceae bacterium]|jgi:L-alanine-DL-glutamate epimerase-like enolase superfamily enzyme|nr:enolase C-terminal domain-like protein [Solirubrobacteraceae bacterium]
MSVEVSEPVAERTPVSALRARTFTVPTDHPEADGTLSWDSTTLVVVEADAEGQTGLGYSYTASPAAAVVRELLCEVVVGSDAHSPQSAWEQMRRAVRNAGYPGLIASAISATDVALWDLKARLLGVALSGLLGRVREQVPVYGSGGFTTYSDEQLERQLRGWTELGIGAVKMKVGSEPERDPYRVRRARAAIGEEARLFVDANGAYSRKQALALADVFHEDAGASWFEEPVSSDDLEGLRMLRDRAPVGMEIAAGEYGYDLPYFRRMLEAGSVDVLQADVTRCGGITQLLQVGALCAARGVQLSAHTSPTLHAHVGVAIAPLVHVEYFHDHARIEQTLFDGTPPLRAGTLEPDPQAPGHGLRLRAEEAERFAH